MLPAITGYLLNIVETYQVKQITGVYPNPSRLLLRVNDTLRQVLQTGEAGQEETLKVEQDRRK